MQIQDTNPHSKLVGIKTDCLVFTNITNTPPTSNKWGDIKISSVPLIKRMHYKPRTKVKDGTI